MSTEQDERDVELLRTRFSAVTRDIVASPTLPERAASAARARRRHRRMSGAGVALGAVTAAAAIALSQPFERTPTVLADTTVTTCPADVPEASNPGASGPDLLPARPGAVLVCGYVRSYGPGMWDEYAPVGSRVIDGAEARAEAAAINRGTAVPGPRRCPMQATDYFEFLFFRNSAGHEAVVVKGGCDGTSDGRRAVDPLPMTWLVRG